MGQQMMWDERYDRDEYVYGKEPNDFLSSVVERIPAGNVLCLADGEGRNGVFLAERGFEVTSVDASGVGVAKTRKLAAERGVSISAVQADLAQFEIGRQTWSAIVAIFCHLPPPLRRVVHAAVVEGLRDGGLLVLEAYTPDQVGRKTGGPPVKELAMSLSELEQELHGLEWLHRAELLREIREGEGHSGVGSVVQMLGRKRLA